ncbi:MAG: DUF3048 domain-containing protein [Bacillota bacterium]|nr:DUF3048 domain-containing protein [Bacillota bacterium]MDW7683727.1 DUF3048 domain-containing protein [Bacillota bacterium]
MSKLPERKMKMRRLWLATVPVLVFFLLIAGGFNSAAWGNPESTKESIDKTRAEITEFEKMIKLLNEDIAERQVRIDELDAEVAETEKQLEKTAAELEEAEARLEENTQKFAGRVRSAYMKGGLSYLEVLLEADNFGDLIVRMAYLTRILNRDAVLVGGIREERAIIQERKTAMEQQRESVQDLRYQQETARKNMLAQRKEVENLLAEAQKKLAKDLVDITPQANRKPAYGVVLDNHANARPQHGLSRASTVYEYEVEGRITRYLALFANFPSKVGPIRSARNHNIMLALENGVNFVHAGGSSDNIAKIAEWGVDSTNALTHSGFYRDSSRRAPHNLYVNLSTLGTASKSGVVVIRPAFVARQGTPAASFSLDYSPTYRIRYQYNPDKGTYRRYINGSIHRDATGAEIAARNIIIQYAHHANDLRGRPTPELIGSGAIDYYVQGERFQGTWRKESISAPTRFFYQDGQEIERVYGQTWIQIARSR